MSGEGKAGAVRDTLAAAPGDPAYPAAGVGSESGTTEWLLDAATASALPGEIERVEVTPGAPASFSP